MAIQTQKPLTRHLVQLLRLLSQELSNVSWEFSVSMQNMASYDLLLFMLKLKPQHDEQIPCHSSFPEGIIRGLHRGSFAVQFGDHLRSGDHLRLGIICGAVHI